MVGQPDPHFSNNQTTGHRASKIADVLCLPSAQAQSFAFAFVPYTHGVIPLCTRAETSATMYDMLNPIQRDTEE